MANHSDKQDALVPIVKPEPAPIISLGQTLPVPMELPSEIRQIFAGWDEAPSWMNPVVVFEKPGDYFVGTLLGVRHNVGPNNSNLYDFAQHDTGEVVSIWGGYVLDETFKLVLPAKGTKVFLMFGGYRPTRQGTRKVKTFTIYTKPPTPQPERREQPEPQYKEGEAF